MRLPGKNEESLILDYCLGLTSPEQTAQVAAFIACNERPAEVYSRIQGALSPLESLHAEPCPEELAERTIRCLCAIAQGTQTSAPTQASRLRAHHREDFWLCLSSNVLMK
jgi:anti-sigma-K factor RskA